MYEKKMDRLSGCSGDAHKFMPARIKCRCSGRGRDSGSDDLLLCSRNSGKMVAAPYQAELARGSRYQVKSPSAEPFVLADPEQAVIEGTLDEDTEIRVYYSDGRKQADYTVIYIGRDGERETVLDKETFRAPAGETVNVEHKDFENFGKEAGQDISGEIEKIEEPVRQGYIFKGWDRALPDIMPEGEYVVNAVWEPGESRYTVLRWMENAEDDGYTLLGETEVRTAQTGSMVTASQEDIERAGMMADWFPDLDYYKAYYGFDYARCEDTEVTADGRAVLNLYYDREIWTVNLHEEAKHESGTSDSLLPNDDIWYTARGKYGAPLPDDFPTMEEMEEHYMGKTQFQDVQFLGVRDEFEAVGRHLDTFYFQDLAAGNHTFDAYPWLEHDSYPVYVTYLKESADGTFRKVRVESAQVDKDPAVHGAEITVLHPKGLTCEGGWYTTGSSIEECEQKERIPISADQIHSDGKCVFRNVGSHLFVYLKRGTFTLNYIDGRSEGNVIYKTENVVYKDKISLDYEPDQDAEHKGDRFAGWYPVGDTAYTVRHMIEGEQEPFYEETGSGKSGDAVFARPLRATDERYPSDQYLESESAGRKITLKQDEDNTITFIYKKADSEGGGILPDSEQEEIMPDTGDVTKAHWAILIMTAALCLIIGPAAVRIHAFRA